MVYIYMYSYIYVACSSYVSIVQSCYFFNLVRSRFCWYCVAILMEFGDVVVV